MEVSAYIPCYNGAALLRVAIEGVRRQNPSELLVIDNASTDGSGKIAEEAGARVIRIEERVGRGACRARAMAEARHPVVLCCDVSIQLPPDFLSRALRRLEQPAVAAVCGQISQQGARNAVDRWRGRHLFRAGTEVNEHADLVTGAALLRADAAREAGGYDGRLEHGEDRELGRRLLARGCKVVYDPSLVYWQLNSNTLGQVLERYWRWHRASGRMTFAGYLRQIKFSITEMARQDMETADAGAAVISLISPHYQYWRDLRE